MVRKIKSPIPALLLLALPLCALHGQQNPHRAPLYWTAYEYCFVTDGHIPENVWAANIDWVEENLKPYGYDMIAIDGWGDDFQFNVFI